jgi:hypothetical protein
MHQNEEGKKRKPLSDLKRKKRRRRSGSAARRSAPAGSLGRRCRGGREARLSGAGWRGARGRRFIGGEGNGGAAGEAVDGGTPTAAINGRGARWAAVSGERKGRGWLGAARLNALRTWREGRRRGEARGRRAGRRPAGQGSGAGAPEVEDNPDKGPHLSVA